MSKAVEWRAHLVGQTHMHLFTDTFWRTDSQCVWCNKTWWDWAGDIRRSICNCGENDPPKPEREIVL